MHVGNENKREDLTHKFMEVKKKYLQHNLASHLQNKIAQLSEAMIGP